MSQIQAPKETVLSGIRATGRLHLGSYLGAVHQFVELGDQSDTKCLYFIADLHTLTTKEERGQIREHLLDIVLDYLAAGVDVEHNSIIYAQSDVPGIPKLAWMLGCISPVGDLVRMPGYQQTVRSIPNSNKKTPEDAEPEFVLEHTSNAGFLFYPVLMAADILAPKSTLVPVGADQRPHLDFAAELARRFNQSVKRDFFPIPKGRINLTVPGLGLMNPDGSFPKMSKSEGTTIGLSVSPAEIQHTIRRAPTDPARKLRTDPGTPEHCAIYALHGFVSSGDEIAECGEGCRTANMGCVECKDVLTK
ncbi:MAG: tryptophan--tRNA ligase, partial [Nanoarchaeota archaeon]|nr:tryptophan--tRNA ligase [Nanoarchaeota archaeon]